MNVADGVDDGVVELIDVVGDEVGQGRVFGVAPEGLDRIEIGRVSGQPFDVEPNRPAFLQLAEKSKMGRSKSRKYDERRIRTRRHTPVLVLSHGRNYRDFDDS